MHTISRTIAEATIHMHHLFEWMTHAHICMNGNTSYLQAYLDMIQILTRARTCTGTMPPYTPTFWGLAGITGVMGLAGINGG